MLTKVHMEALSPTMEEGQIVKWLMAEGEAVSEGDVLAEVETDKAVMELVARGEGLLRMILLPEGGTAPVGKVIAVIAEADEDVSSFTGEAEVVEPVVSSSAAEVVEPVDDPDQTSSPNSVEIQPVADGQRIKASPVARKIASKSGLVLADIPGSGPAGRIIKKDIEGVLSDQGAVSPGVVSQELGPEQYEDIPLTQMRKTIARRLSE
ncbi:uncharacterized protein METZ01_LOCUS478646, partial [marine metagenome]